MQYLVRISLHTESYNSALMAEPMTEERHKKIFPRA